MPSIQLLGNTGITYIDKARVKRNSDVISKWKVIMSKTSAEHAGETDKNGMKRIVSKIMVLPPEQICSETYHLLDTFDTEQEAINLCSYIKTRFSRFLLSTVILTQNIAKDKFKFLPIQDFRQSWMDKKLYKKYKLSEDEIKFIESMIKPME